MVWNSNFIINIAIFGGFVIIIILTVVLYRRKAASCSTCPTCPSCDKKSIFQLKSNLANLCLSVDATTATNALVITTCNSNDPLQQFKVNTSGQIESIKYVGNCIDDNGANVNTNTPPCDNCPYANNNH